MPKISSKYRLVIPRPKEPALPSPLKFLLYKAEEPKPWLSPPEWWQGDVPEWAVYFVLTELGEDFTYQEPLLGGRTTAGGAVVDFFVPSRQLVIRVQGVYFHYQQGFQQESFDQLQKAALESKGYIVVDIDDVDLLRDAWYYVKEALEGREHSRFTNGE